MQGGPPTSDAHQGCQQRLAMEPPRYCATCRRRMKVQVTPLGWSAECSRHGRVTS
ncbi:biotin synthase auxiliary protein BsaP [Arthrobacter sp. MMS24-S77]